MKEEYGRFVDSIDLVNGEYILIISDIDFWCDHEEEILIWLDDNVEGGSLVNRGMVLSFKNKEDAMWFKLRWDGK